MTTEKTLTIPTIHLNGTGKETLLREYQDALHALHNTIHAMQQVTVHGRDYYVQDGDAIGKAIAEHRARLEALYAVANDMQIILLSIHDQIKS